MTDLNGLPPVWGPLVRVRFIALLIPVAEYLEGRFSFTYFRQFSNRSFIVIVVVTLIIPVPGANFPQQSKQVVLIFSLFLRP